MSSWRQNETFLTISSTGPCNSVGWYSQNFLKSIFAFRVGILKTAYELIMVILCIQS
jgi:hypothetical protein